jgi:hypothetical protein
MRIARLLAEEDVRKEKRRPAFAGRAWIPGGPRDHTPAGPAASGSPGQAAQVAEEDEMHGLGILRIAAPKGG